MTRRAAVGALTTGVLARELTARAGQPMPALRCYESLAALWIRCCDTGLPGAGVLREKTWRAARRLAAGEDTVLAPEHESIPARLTRDASLVRVPASLAVQGVEWPDATGLAQRWLDTRAWTGPALVAGVRTGGAYLAPLVAAHLEAAGIDVRLTSLRPGEEYHAGDRRVLLVDDPPLTGRTLLALAQEVSGPGGVEVLVPVFAPGDVRGLREAGIAVTVLPREQWQSTRRLEPEALLRLPGGARRLAGRRAAPACGRSRGRAGELRPHPVAGSAAPLPARAAVRLRTPDGVRQAVAGWVPPGIFGDAARAVATGVQVRFPRPPSLWRPRSWSARTSPPSVRSE